MAWRPNLVTAAAPVLLTGLGVLAGAPLAVATPHVLTNPNHPYDPDWPAIKMLLAEKCTGCHRTRTDEDGKDRHDLTSYEALMRAGVEDGYPAVTPGRPDDSALWEAVAWNATADPDCDLCAEPCMPQDKHEWLTAGQLEMIKRWIERGANKYRAGGSERCCSPLTEADFPSAKQCRACHPKQYREWSRSMHAYAQHSPMFEAFNLTLQERTGGTIGTFCTRCHTPVGTALGENGLLRNVHRSRTSMEGVTCVVCHRQSKAYHKSNARQYLEPGGSLDVCMFGPFENSVAVPQGHKAQANPFIKTSEFCGSCHDVTSPDGVRLEEAFSEWRHSPAASRGVTCQHCHMGPVQGKPTADCQRPLGRAAQVPGVDPKRIPLRPLSDHTFAGPDYSMLPDTEWPHKLDWMYETDYRDPSRLTPYQQKTLLELRERNRELLADAHAKRLEVLRNSACIALRAPRRAVAGEAVALRVDVQSLFDGHNLPAGFSAERQVWIALTVTDALGRVVFASGDLDKNGDLRDEHSHAVETRHAPIDRHLVNFQNKFTAVLQKGNERTVVLSVNRHLTPISLVRPATSIAQSRGRAVGFRLAKASLAPAGRRGQTYPIILPAEGDYLVDAKLNFRHLPPALLDAIGTPHLKHLLEVVVIDSKQTVVTALPAHVAARRLPLR
ncbi:MAG: multiheme c-type cytochrome [Planctomycetota bacterium]